MNSGSQFLCLMTDMRFENLLQGQMRKKQTMSNTAIFYQLLRHVPIFGGTGAPVGDLYVNVVHHKTGISFRA